MNWSLFFSCIVAKSGLIRLNNGRASSTDQVIIRIPRLGGINDGSYSCEVGEDALRRSRAIIEQEHDPGVDQGSMLSGDNDGSLVVRVVLGESAHSFKNLGSIFRVEYIVASPDLCQLDFHRTSQSLPRLTFSEMGYVWRVYAVTIPKLLPPPLRAANRSIRLVSRVPTLPSLSSHLTSVLLCIGINDRAIGKDHFKVDDAVRCPAVLRAEETQATYSSKSDNHLY